MSEDEDDQMTREEKKAKIKEEIARRRQQIQENMRLHDELYKLADRQRDRLEPGESMRAKLTYETYNSLLLTSKCMHF